VEKLTVQVEKLTWDMERDQGKYLAKEDVRTELALKISAFEAGFKHIAVTRASDWIAAVAGRQEKQQVLVDMVNNAIDTLLDEFSRVDELDLVIEDAR
jgi:C4-dicarboxylate-specific signal transduction histidine kinase